MTYTTVTSRNRGANCILTGIVCIVGCWIPWISGQPIHIAYGTGSSQPTEGDTDYQLDCIISNLPTDVSLVWSKDSQDLFWNEGESVTDLDMTGTFTVKEYIDADNNVNTHFVLTLSVVNSQHSGQYKCFIAKGEVMNYTISATSMAVHIEVQSVTANPDFNPITNPSFPDGQYFPSEKWPKCYPQNDVVAVIYTNMTIRCVSAPGNPAVAVTLYDFKGNSIGNSYINQTSPLIERIYTFRVLPNLSDNDKRFSCQIFRQSDGVRYCDMADIRIGLFATGDITVEGSEYASALFSCAVGTGSGISWFTVPEIDSTRLEMSPNTELLKINGVKLIDNGTQVICRLDSYNLQDQIRLLVIPPNTSNTVPTTGKATMSVSQDPLLTSTLNSLPSSSTKHTTTSTSDFRDDVILTSTIIAAIGGGGGLLVIAVILCIVAICCCRCRNRESDIKFEDGGTTRISTGYMWDKELSHMVHESPRPSPKLTNNNHAHVRQALKDPDESDPSMSPSLAYALANHSDDDLDSDDGDLKKPVSAAYETVDLNPAGRVLGHGASMLSNLYASTAIVAPNPPMSSNTSADFPPQYAVPDKNKCPSSKADDDAIPTESPYAIVHPDPENPMVRASLKQRATEGNVNAAYDPNEEGFVENSIYEPAGR